MSESAEVDQAILDKTKKELGAVIRSPKLSDRLLKKPPFRFLHDIVTGCIKATGFASKLYSDEEMDSAKVTEKEAKVFFLQKIISSVNYTLKLSPPLAAKPIKIVSGLEPAHTNDFLQKLATATKVPIEKSDKAIQKVLARMADKAEQALKQERKASQQNEQQATSSEPAPAEPAAADEKKAATQQPPSQQPPADDKPSDAEAKKAEAEAALKRADAEAKAEAEKKAEEEKQAAAAEKVTPTPIERREEKSKAKEKKEVAAAPTPVGVMVEGGKKEGGDKGTLDTDSESDHEPSAEGPFPGLPDADATADGDGGKLAQMVAAKKADEEAKQKLAKESADKEEEESGGIRLQTQRHRQGKDREVFSTEVQKLKESLQTLVKITNPLGKTFDYVQEDIDSMTKEKQMWQRSVQDVKVQAMEAEHSTEEALQPLYGKLQDLEDSISDQLNKIHNTRANILKNDANIETLLRMVVS
eukprot:TRINITY_DN7751_c0_g1_i1.p1 TRINITY_DN7751_c0_g1~~TRINITY_DN7751_c0_g1_i1.p1  ORF type:complete len:491 (+),score=157.86 TRINITY_DN7751_c0_g1_i1:60-1475(+)